MSGPADSPSDPRKIAEAELTGRPGSNVAFFSARREPSNIMSVTISPAMKQRIR